MLVVIAMRNLERRTELTNDELSKFITENIMRECWHEPKELEKGTPQTCNKCGLYTIGSRVTDKWHNKPYATDLNIMMKAVEKFHPEGFTFGYDPLPQDYWAMVNKYYKRDTFAPFAIGLALVAAWEEKEEK